MGFGGGSSQPSTQIIQPPNPPGGPLQDQLVSNAGPMLDAAIPFAHFGSGAQLLPRSPLGQVFMPGPNPTIFGNPFDASTHAGFFGQAGGNTPPPQQHSPQPQQQGPGQQVAQQGQPSPFQNPNSPGAQMLNPLANLLHPGVLSQLFQLFGQQNHPPQQGGQQQQNQVPQQAVAQGGQQQQQGA